MSAIALRPLGQRDLNLVSGVKVAPDQIRYSGTITQAFKAKEKDVDFHAILNGSLAVGFFKIDRTYPQRYDFALTGELGLRAFMINFADQGKGYATGAVQKLTRYLAVQYPAAPSIVLTVNFANPGAIACYRRGGFHDTGEVYSHGAAGPQHVMRMDLG
jgi:RimJ/RimL family protein N-acetyltransferase